MPTIGPGPELSDRETGPVATGDRAKRKSLLSADFVRAILAGHSALGLAFAALIYVVCLSGTITVFTHELERWENPQGPLLETIDIAAINAGLQNTYAAALKNAPLKDIFIVAPSEQSPWFEVMYRGMTSRDLTTWLVNADGHPAQLVATPFATFIADLHVYLHLPRTIGLFVVGLVGVALLSLLLSGLLAHPRIFKDAFAVRWGGSRRLQEADLHNRLSVWGLPFHFVVALSGALLGLSTLIIGLLAMAAYDGDGNKAFAVLTGPRPSPASSPAPLPDLAAMMAEIQRTAPEATFDAAVIQSVGTQGQAITIQAPSPGHLTAGERYYFDAKGIRLGSSGSESGSLGQRILGMLQPLHFGWFGGIWMKIAYGLLGLALTVVTTSGVAIWLLRRRDKGRPAPAWERTWAAIVWSQPLAIGALALLAHAVPEHSLIVLYLAALALSGGVAFALNDAREISRALRLSSSGLLVIAAVIHIMSWADRVADPAAWIVNLVLILTGTILAAPEIVRWCKRAPIIA